MCCLGFAARALGCSVADIRDVSYPSGIKKNHRLKVARLLQRDGIFNKPETHMLARINDDSNIPDSLREKKLTALGKAVGLLFRFID
jgi:hypothetical protein